MGIFVSHKILGKGEILCKSNLSVEGFDYKVRFENGLTTWCSKKELHVEKTA